MNRNEWKSTATEQNAVIEQLSAFLSVGCLVIPFIFIVVILIIAAFMA